MTSSDPSHAPRPTRRSRPAAKKPLPKQETQGTPAASPHRAPHTRSSTTPPVSRETTTHHQLPVEGILELHPSGYGFIHVDGYRTNSNDVYVPIKRVREYYLRPGDYVVGTFHQPSKSERYPSLDSVATINGYDPALARFRVHFSDLTPLFPNERYTLESPALITTPSLQRKTSQAEGTTARIIDLLAPIGKGTRGLIVAPPRAGKTTVIKQIALAIETNHPTAHLMMLLIDERPEEVTDIRRALSAEVLASTFDRPAVEHTRLAELALERAKRLVEQGRDVVIILDGITRLARAYNLAAPATGRIMSGGIDSGALYSPKRFFGAARNIEEGGSLTILATALVETGSKMDEVIFEEFKGTGNAEIRLDRRLSERRIYPAIDVHASSTRHEELLFSPEELPQVWKLRRVLTGLEPQGGQALDLLIEKIRTTTSNQEFLKEIAASGSPRPVS
jgi:transcription termination factor Rho